MTEHLTGHDGISSDNGDEQQRATGKYGRRALMLGAAAGVGAAASLAAKPEIAAANGTPVELGESNSATATTEVTTTSGNGLMGQTTDNGQSGVYGVDDSSAGGYGVYGTSNEGTGVYGSATTSGSGVSGYSNSGAGVSGTSGMGPGVSGSGMHYGVYGTSSSEAPFGGAGVYGSGFAGVIASGRAYGVQASGSTAQLYLVPATTAGHPKKSTGAHQVGEIFLDVNAALWLCQAAGTPGTWVELT